MPLKRLTALALAAPCLMVTASATAQSDSEEGSAAEADESTPQEYTDRFPPKLEGVFARKPSACRKRSFAVEGKVGIRGKRLIVDGQPFEIGEVLESSQIALVGDFVAPGGYGKPVRMSFTIRQSGKLIVRTFGGRTAPPMLAHYRCKPQR